MKPGRIYSFMATVSVLTCLKRFAQRIQIVTEVLHNVILKTQRSTCSLTQLLFKNMEVTAEFSGSSDHHYIISFSGLHLLWNNCFRFMF